MSVKPIGYTDSGEPVWPVSQDPMGGCDHPHSWLCDELGYHTDQPYEEIGMIVRGVLATISEREDGYAYSTMPALRLKADLHAVLAIHDSEATDPCQSCWHPFASHTVASFESNACLCHNCACESYVMFVDDLDDGGHCPDGCCP